MGASLLIYEIWIRSTCRYQELVLEQRVALFLAVDHAAHEGDDEDTDDAEDGEAGDSGGGDLLGGNREY